MSSDFTIAWWIVFFGIPTASGLLILILRNRDICDKTDQAIRSEMQKMHEAAIKLSEEHRRAADMGIIAMRADFNSYQLRIAESYVSSNQLKEFDDRLMNALDKIDHKIDGTLDRLLKLERQATM